MMKNKMSLKPKPSTELNLKKVILYTVIAGSVLSGLIYGGLTFFGVIGSSEEAFAAQVTGYSWDAVITIDNNKVSGATNLIDFPLVVSITNPVLKSVSNGGMVENINGFDIVFADMNNDQLDHQIESYNPVTGEYVAWVRIPILSPTVDTDFKMFYGNSSVLANLSTENVWNSNYESVWHMDNNPSNTDLNDGAGNNDGKDYGGMNANDLITGKIGMAIDFDGNNDYYAIKNKKYSGVGEIPVLTVTGWFKTTFNNNNYASNWSLLDFDRSEYFNVFVHGNGKVGFSTRGSGSGPGINDFYAGNIGQYNDGNWHHVAAVYDGTNKYLYMDGVLAATKNNAHAGNPIGRGVFQRYGFIGEGSEASSFNGPKNNKYYKGQYDEIRLLHVVLSPDWIATECANQDSPNTFYSIVFGASPLPVELISFNVKLTDNSAEITWSTATEINNDYFTIEKSIDAVNYEIVDEVVGSGNSNTIKEYNYLDDNVFDGVSYYRLKQTDFDGQYEYFSPKSINSSSEASSLKIATVKPNPFTNQFTIVIESKKEGIVDFMLTNMSGVKVFETQIELNEERTEYTYNKGGGLSPGTYIIKIIQDASTTTYKIIKN